MDSIFNFLFLTGFTGLTGFFSPAARDPLAEGPSIQMILQNGTI
jgi:hypothetical protein